jgi:hypothetical protein
LACFNLELKAASVGGLFHSGRCERFFFGASALSIARFGDGGDDRRNGGDPVVVVNAAMTRR